MLSQSMPGPNLIFRACALGGLMTILGLMAAPLAGASPQAPETKPQASEVKPRGEAKDEAKDPASPKKHAYLKKRTGHGGDPAHRKPAPKPTPKPGPKKAPKAPTPHAPAPHAAPHAPAPHPGVPK